MAKNKDSKKKDNKKKSNQSFYEWKDDPAPSRRGLLIGLVVILLVIVVAGGVFFSGILASDDSANDDEDKTAQNEDLSDNTDDPEADTADDAPDDENAEVADDGETDETLDTSEDSADTTENDTPEDKSDTSDTPSETDANDEMTDEDTSSDEMDEQNTADEVTADDENSAEDEEPVVVEDDPEANEDAEFAPSGNVDLIENVPMQEILGIYPSPDSREKIFSVLENFSPHVAGRYDDWLYIYYFYEEVVFDEDGETVIHRYIDLRDGWVTRSRLDISNAQFNSLRILNPENLPPLPDIEYTPETSLPFVGVREALPEAE